jgi:hypothetical protein
VLVPGPARADATCSGLLPQKIAYLQQNSGNYDIEITVTKDSLPYVTYSLGWIYWSNPWLYGSANLLFSDRYAAGSQPFNVNAKENIQVWIDSVGHLWIWNNQYSYWVVSGADMSCVGGLISKYVPGLGLVTVALRQWVAPIQ